MEKIIDENAEHRNVLAASISNNPMDNFTDVNNSSYRPHASHNSTVSNESDLSLLSMSLDKELITNVDGDMDELPAFEIRLISPLGRTPSPIDSEDMATPTRPPVSVKERLTPSPCQNNPEFVALHDINAQISPPSDNEDQVELASSRTNSLETIFEGVFLHTPQRQRANLQHNLISRSRKNLLEKATLNRFNIGKENQSPLSKYETSPIKQISIGGSSCVTDVCSEDGNHTFA